MIGSEESHDKLIDIIIKDLKSRDENIKWIWTKFNYYNKGKVAGELDAMAIRDKYVLLFECKCNNNHSTHNKAVKQLNRAESYMESQGYRIFKLMAYYKPDNSAGYKWIKN